MRPKFVTVVVLLALGLFGIISLVERGLHPQLVTPTAADGDDLSQKRWRKRVGAASNEWAKGGADGKLERAVSAPSRGAKGGPPGSAQQSSEAGDTDHDEYVRQRIAELDKLAREKGADSLNTILSELQNPDKEIRKGALEAAIEFHDRSALPRLREIALSTEDPREKVEILEAIEFLELPTLTEYLAEQQVNNTNSKPPKNPSSLPQPLK